MPYAEWYLNTLKIPGSPTSGYHTKTFGKDFDYYHFIKPFNDGLGKWNPQTMAAQLQSFGARYVVLTAKHHDGFTLWPSRVPNYNFPASQPAVSVDIVGELTKAVRSEGMRMGIYYSGGLDWSFNKVPITDLSHLWTSTPEGSDYCAYADAHVKELINNYLPDVLWNDIGYPQAGNLEMLLANYFFQVPEGTVNDRWKRWGKYEGDFKTPEYSKFDSITPFKWETCRGIGFSFGYNQLEDASHYLKSSEIIRLLIDVVSKNGNLLLNIGPQADGTIPDIQLNNLKEVGNWLRINGEAIYDSEPWKVAGTNTEHGEEVRFTTKANTLFLFVLDAVNANEIRINLSQLPKIGRVVSLADQKEVAFSQKGNTLTLQTGKKAANTAFKLEVAQ